MSKSKNETPQEEQEVVAEAAVELEQDEEVTIDDLDIEDLEAIAEAEAEDDEEAEGFEEFDEDEGPYDPVGDEVEALREQVAVLKAALSEVTETAPRRVGPVPVAQRINTRYPVRKGDIVKLVADGFEYEVRNVHGNGVVSLEGDEPPFSLFTPAEYEIVGS